ncbi:hypothetical protein AUC69_11450 [Methyloceanibacter superfactus]|uniref:DUF4431 domain-containing protein n=1 Tax=Methyloceanibacter superfactus TaxID=1774969 RepID=A0A1E3VVZ5_9HYPH|nr:DUF4431 domain-containing protein [Methyloceanibacter superfactus]ODR97707.1 hypothetical protein AUC69_11450 [Methyloceanibacter superfactus]
MKHATWLLSLILMLAASSAQAASCLQANAPGEIAEGRLSLGQFEDAAGRPEQAFILTLPAPACLEGSEETDNIGDVATIHVYALDETLSAALRKFVGKEVQVRGTPFGAHTAHHHAPIMMDISEIDEI